MIDPSTLTIKQFSALTARQRYYHYNVARAKIVQQTSYIQNRKNEEIMLKRHMASTIKRLQFVLDHPLSRFHGSRKNKELVKK